MIRSPQNPQELFNLRHSSLRNAIERIFCVLKNRFKLLTRQLEHPFSIQVQLVNAICCLHNIIRQVGGDDILDEDWLAKERLGTNVLNNDDNVSTRATTSREVAVAKVKRDEIAIKMWRNYRRSLK